MAEFTVTSSEVANKAAELQRINGQYKTAVDALETTASSLSSMWEGEAHDAFYSAFNKDKVQMTNFYNAIEKYVTTLQQIAAKYAESESRNVTTASS